MFTKKTKQNSSQSSAVSRKALKGTQTEFKDIRIKKESQKPVFPELRDKVPEIKSRLKSMC